MGRKHGSAMFEPSRRKRKRSWLHASKHRLTRLRAARKVV